MLRRCLLASWRMTVSIVGWCEVLLLSNAAYYIISVDALQSLLACSFILRRRNEKKRSVVFAQPYVDRCWKKKRALSLDWYRKWTKRKWCLEYTANEESLIRIKFANRDVSGSGISNLVKSQIGDLPRLGNFWLVSMKVLQSDYCGPDWRFLYQNSS